MKIISHDSAACGVGNCVSIVARVGRGCGVGEGREGGVEFPFYGPV